MYTNQSNSFACPPLGNISPESELFCVKWSPPIDGFQQFIKDYRTITNCPLGGSKSTRYSYTDPTIAKVLSVGPSDNRSALPQRISLSNFKIGSPITSYGVILRASESEPYYLIVKRNNSVSYIDIIRGNYRESQLFLMIQDLPQHERDRLLKYDFDTLWFDLHQKPPEGDVYEFGKEAYQKLSPHLPQLFSKIPSIDPYGKYLWLFPKGRPEWQPNENEKHEVARFAPLIPESGYECALREFMEETNGLDLAKINARLLFPDPLIERYLGTNSKQYQTNYFVFETQQLDPITQFPTKSTGIREISTGEVAEIKWVRQSELHHYLHPARIEFVNYIETHLPTQLPADVNPIWRSPAEMSDYNLDES
jgi:8-oxo-dGTP pyrophosphatase MutT (NUDIX family)